MRAVVVAGYIAAAGLLIADLKVAGGTLGDIVGYVQRYHVRESYGVEAGECFTWVDFAQFERTGTLARITAELRTDRAFLAAIAKVSAMPVDDQRALLVKCRRLSRPTWAEIREISPRGTTEAGRRAERMIAEAIVDLAEELLRARGGGVLRSQP